MLAAWASAAFGEPPPPPAGMQDMVIIGRVLGFQQRSVSGDQLLAIVYDPADAASTREAKDIAVLIGSGLAVSEIVLHSVLVAQPDLARTDHVDAILATASVDDQLLRRAISRLHVPCLTLHFSQVEHGSCMVALRSSPTVNIVLNQANADAAGVHFATAFRMMVQEL